MTSREEIIEKIVKVQAFAERGATEGERSAAAAMVDRLMRLHDITDDELIQDKVERRWFRYPSKDKYARKMMTQVIYAVTGDGSYWTRGRKAVSGVDCTAAQAVEIEAMFEFYYGKFVEDVGLFYSAFLSKNDIYPTQAVLDAVGDEDEDEDDTPMDMERAMKIRDMMGGMEKHDFRKQLGGE